MAGRADDANTIKRDLEEISRAYESAVAVLIVKDEVAR